MNQLDMAATDSLGFLQHAVTFAQLNDKDAKDSLRTLTLPVGKRHDFANADAVAIRDEIASILRAVLQGRPVDVSTNLEWRIWRDAAIEGGRPLFTTSGAGGSVRDLVLFRLRSALEKVGIDKVRECKAPGCERLFIKLTRKEFCSAECQIRENNRQQRLNAKRA